MNAGLVMQVAALGCVAAGAVDDVRSFEIADRWSIAVVVLFAAFVAIGNAPAAWWLHAAAGMTMFAVGAGLFARGWLGGGDVKLLAACAVWTGFAGLPWLLGGTAVVGGGLAILAVAGRRLSLQPSYPSFQPDGPLPYAVAILGGAIVFATA